MKREFGRLDILINNAGIMVDDPAKKVSEQSLDIWRRTFETNVFAISFEVWVKLLLYGLIGPFAEPGQL